MLHDSKPAAQPERLNPLTAVFAGLVIAGLAILVFQHWMHVWVWLPYVLILCCPLMMLWMMKGMNTPKSP